MGLVCACCTLILGCGCLQMAIVFEYSQLHFGGMAPIFSRGQWITLRPSMYLPRSIGATIPIGTGHFHQSTLLIHYIIAV